MSDIYTGDPNNNPASQTQPEDGDALDAASVLADMQASADKIAHILDGEPVFTGIKDFSNKIIVNGGSDNEAAIAMGSGTARKLWSELGSGGQIESRIYGRAQAGIYLPGFELVTNALWDSVAALWDFDTLTASATNEGARMVEVLSTGGAAVADNNTGLAVRMKKLHIASAFAGNFVFDAAADTITTTGNFVTAGFLVGDVIKITGSVSNNGNHTVVTVTATVMTVGNTLVNETIAAAGVVIRTAPWADGGWDAQHLGLSCKVTTPTQAGLRKNTLYPGNLLKAWGRYVTDSLGGITILDGFGLVSAAISGNNARVTLRNAMVTGYSVAAHSHTLAALHAVGSEVTTTTLDVRLYAVSAGAEYDQGGFIATGTFYVCGEQA